MGSRLIASITGSRLLGPLASGFRNVVTKLPGPLRSIFSRAGIGGAALVGVTAFAVPVFNKVKQLDLGIPTVKSETDELFYSFKRCLKARSTDRYTAMIELPCGNRTPDPKTPKVEKDTSLVPGTPEHKQNRWEVYKANGGKWSYEQWSKTYDANMKKASRSHQLVENYRKTLN
ncbi:hypothetical protein I8U20_11200 [Thermoactinomyces intermedius]|uniref:Uncharacterized protein n=1 Tax=Thermoactinomyces intermedius TaxID=2024 RepID=A0A8I1ADQ1_THEIN|nr:hypothetical protein [Thermoactinomyces intermedius]MBA4549662.1 hypothetical protein [Thermoactinomyces intermedius]MBH8595897.1 hypothetical protein [Thermoactinomyces intermedius]